MDFKDLKNKSEKELLELLKENEQKLFFLKLQSKLRRLKQVHEVAQMRKLIARIKMLLDVKK